MPPPMQRAITRVMKADDWNAPSFADGDIPQWNAATGKFDGVPMPTGNGGGGDYLPLAGGTLTGPVIFDVGAPATFNDDVLISAGGSFESDADAVLKKDLYVKEVGGSIFVINIVADHASYTASPNTAYVNLKAFDGVTPVLDLHDSTGARQGRWDASGRVGHGADPVVSTRMELNAGIIDWVGWNRGLRITGAYPALSLWNGSRGCYFGNNAGHFQWGAGPGGDTPTALVMDLFADVSGTGFLTIDYASILQWGSSGFASPDIKFERFAAATMKMTGKFLATLGLGIGNAVVATEMPSIPSYKAEVFDETGAFKGYLYLFDS